MIGYHKGDPCIYCRVHHDAVPVGPCSAYTRAWDIAVDNFPMMTRSDLQRITEVFAPVIAQAKEVEP